MFVSCGDQPKQNPLIGKWKETNYNPKDTITQWKDISFQDKQGKREFSATNWYSNKIQGDWLLEGKTLTLTYLAPKQRNVDSIVVEDFGVDGTRTTYFEDNSVVQTLENGTVKSTQTTDKIQILVLDDRNLEFQWNGVKHKYVKTLEHQSSVSFWSILRGAIGITSLIVISFLFSNNRRRIDWSLVVKGLALQIVIALLVLKVPFVENGFMWVSQKFVKLISYTNEGVNFLFAQFGMNKIDSTWGNFAITVLPTIIFFSALMSVLYYIGVLQKVVFVFAWIMKRFMRVSGAESLAAAGNVFMGQTESPLLVKPYLAGMTKSELLCLMTGGMATIAGGVLAAYVNFLGGDDPVQQAFFAKHLLTASIISAPAAIVAAKILIPETEEFNKDLKIDKQKLGTNILEAISNGTTDGLKLAVNVAAMLLVFIALMALGNGILSWIGDITSLNEVIAANTNYSGLSFEFILGYIGAPVVWLLGVESGDMLLVGELLGQKTILNEFVAYPRLGEMNQSGQLSEKSVIISTYMLCGFANFASIGIQIGGIGSLIPSRKGLLSELGMRALLGGTVASLLTAAIVGMLY